MALPIDSDWPYFFLNSLSPEAGSTPGGGVPGASSAGGLASTATTTNDLGLGSGQDAAELQKSLDAWTNISFNFDNADDQFVVAAEPKKPDPASSSSPSGIVGGDLANGPDAVADLDDLSRHDPRRGVGTETKPSAMDHHFFPGPQEHAFRLPPSASQRRPYRPYDLPTGTSPHHLSPFQTTGAATGQIVQPDQLSIADPAPSSADTFSSAGQTFSQLLQADPNLVSFLGSSGATPTVSSSTGTTTTAGTGTGQAAADNAAAAAAFGGTGMPILRPFTTPDGRTVSSLSELLGNADALIAATTGPSSSPSLPVPSSVPVLGGGQAQVVKPGKLSRRSTMMGEDEGSRGVTPSATAAATSMARTDSAYADDLDDDDEANKRAVEEDKRRRNTAASARFRIKKKLREQAVEKTAQELRERVLDLEKEVDGLKKENGWLRNLIVDRAAKDAGSSFPTASSTAGPSSGPEGQDAPEASIPVVPSQQVTTSGRVSKRRRD